MAYIDETKGAYLVGKIKEWSSEKYASKATTLEGYGITDAYTKTEIDEKAYITKAVTDLENYYLKSETYTQEEINSKISVIPKFSILPVDELPTENISTTTIYLLKDAEEESGNLYTEYIYVNEKWEILGSQKAEVVGVTSITKAEYLAKKEEYDASGNFILLTDVGEKYTYADSEITSDAIEGDSTVKEALVDLDTNKVDKEDGKGLSTNDYTTAEKTKLAGIAEGATKVTVDSEMSDTSENPVQNKVINTALSSKMSTSNPTGTGSFSLNRKSGSTVGSYSFAEGYKTIASGEYSHAEGNETTASGDKGAHAEGYSTTASGKYGAHAEGNETTASGDMSHAEGYSTTASGSNAHAEGGTTTASGGLSHAEGYNTLASSNYQHVQGKYNVADTTSSYAHIVGGGTSTTDRKNIHTLDWSGNAVFAGDVTATDSSGNAVSLTSVNNNLADQKTTIATLTSKLNVLTDIDILQAFLSSNSLTDYFYLSTSAGDIIRCNGRGWTTTDETGRLLVWGHRGTSWSTYCVATLGLSGSWYTDMTNYGSIGNNSNFSEFGTNIYNYYMSSAWGGYFSTSVTDSSGTTKTFSADTDLVWGTISHIVAYLTLVKNMSLSEIESTYKIS